MNTIGKYISDLLILHDCVIVPGLGGFVANYQPATLSEEKGLFLPPKKEIGFNRSLMHNDGLLINHVSLHKGISYIESQKLVDAFVSELWTNLGDYKSAAIGEVGLLKKDSAGNLLFQPSESSSFYPDVFGLGVVPLPASESVKSTKEGIERSVHRITLPRIPHRQVAAGIAIIAGLFLLTPSLHTPHAVSQGAIGAISDISFISAPVAVVPDTTTLALADSIADTLTVEAVEPQAVAVAAVESVPAVKVTPVAETEPAWFLIAASFPNKQDAEGHLKRLEKKGMTNCRVVNANGKYRVAIDYFDHRAEALSAMNNYRSKDGFESVWLMRNN